MARVIVLHDQSDARGNVSSAVFERLAARTGGAVLPFDPSSTEALRALLEAVGTLAVGGLKRLRELERTLPAAAQLLHLLGDGEG